MKDIELQIARRMSSSAKGGTTYGGGSVMQTVATVSVGIGIAVMALTLAIIFGFKREIAKQMSSLSGQVVVCALNSGAAMDQAPIYKSETLGQMFESAAHNLQLSLKGFAPFASRAAIIRSGDFADGVLLKGLDSLSDLGFVRNKLLLGEVPKFGEGESNRGVVISKSLADQAKLKIGDKLELLLPDDKGKRGLRRDLYRVSAVYENDMGEEQSRLIFTDIRNVQRVNGWMEDEISGYEIWISQPMQASNFSAKLNQDLLFAPENERLGGTISMSMQDLNPQIFDWLAVHDVNAAVVISIMMIVAIFNIITTMLILVLERSHMIGILKTLGMNNRSLGRIFLFRAMNITLRGLAAGNIFACLFCFLQQKYKFLTLDEGGYMLSFVPVDLDFGWLSLLNLMVLGVVALLVVIPTRMVSKVEPTEAIRFR